MKLTANGHVLVQAINPADQSPAASPIKLAPGETLDIAPKPDRAYMICVDPHAIPNRASKIVDTTKRGFAALSIASTDKEKAAPRKRR